MPFEPTVCGDKVFISYRFVVVAMALVTENNKQNIDSQVSANPGQVCHSSSEKDIWRLVSNAMSCP